MVGKVHLMERNRLMVVLLAKSHRKVVNEGGGDRGCFSFVFRRSVANRRWKMLGV